MIRIVTVVFAVLIAACARADEAILFGHNLSPTNYTLHKGEASVGNFIAGVGVNDNLTVGTSPWLYTSYNMYSVVGRYGAPFGDERRWGLQGAYFKTDRILADVYQMEATSVWLSASQRIAPHYTLNIVANHMYFFDETIPFSLRRNPGNDQPWQFSLTSLHEVALVRGFGFLAELGVLGLNYAYPELYFGTSVNWRASRFLAQFGFSQNLTPNGAGRLYTPQQAFGATSGDYYDQAMHPEIHLQAYF